MNTTCIGAPMGGRQLADIALATAEHLAADGQQILIVEAYPPNTNVTDRLGPGTLTVSEQQPAGMVYLTAPSGLHVVSPPRPLWPQLREVDLWDDLFGWIGDRYDHVLVTLPVLEADTDGTRWLRRRADRLVLVLSQPSQRHGLEDLLGARDLDGRLVTVALGDTVRARGFVGELAEQVGIGVDVIWPEKTPVGERPDGMPGPAKPRPKAAKLAVRKKASRRHERRAVAARQVADIIDRPTDELPPT